jgi:hypothetical protein
MYLVLILFVILGLFYYWKYIKPTDLFKYFNKNNQLITLSDTDKLIQSDIELSDVLHELKTETLNIQFDFNKINEDVHKFFDIYIKCFYDSKYSSRQCMTMIDIYREVLNHLLNININANIVAQMNESLWKYIYIIISKHNLEDLVNTPYPKNVYQGNDVF